MRSAIFLLGVCSAAVTSAACAQTPDSHFYAGVSVGESSVDGRAQTPSVISSPGSFPPAATLNGFPFDDEDTAWSAFVGYAATPYIGVELGYWNHGRFEAPRLAAAPISLEIQELFFGATLRYPLFERFAVTASAGISRAQFDAEGRIAVLVTFPPPGSIQVLPIRAPDDETGGYWQLGLNWQFSKAMEAGVSFGRRALHVQEVESTSLSLRYRF